MHETPTMGTLGTMGTMGTMGTWGTVGAPRRREGGGRVGRPAGEASRTSARDGGGASLPLAIAVEAGLPPTRDVVAAAQRLAGNAAAASLVAARPGGGLVVQRTYDFVPSQRIWQKDTAEGLLHSRSPGLRAIDAALAALEAATAGPTLGPVHKALGRVLAAVGAWETANDPGSRHAARVRDLRAVVDRKLGLLLDGPVRGYDDAIADGDLARARAAADRITGTDPDFFRLLVPNRIEKTGGEGDEWTKTLLAAPIRYLGTAEYGLATGHFAGKASFGWLARREQADDLIDVLETLKAGQFRQFVSMVSSPGLRAALARLAGQRYAQLVHETPMLATLAGVEARLGPGADPDAVAAEIFHALLTGRGLKVRYRGKGDDTLEPLVKVMPKAAPMACHNLANALVRLLEAWPGKAIRVGIATIADPVLTQPLDQIKGSARAPGLIDPSFRGNVLLQKGTRSWLTGRIFFPGWGSAPHTWVVANGIAYDPLFGTIGEEVAAAAWGTFTGSSEEGWTGPGGASIRVAGSGLRNRYGLGTAYVLEGVD